MKFTPPAEIEATEALEKVAAALHRINDALDASSKNWVSSSSGQLREASSFSAARSARNGAKSTAQSVRPLASVGKVFCIPPQ